MVLPRVKAPGYPGCLSLHINAFLLAGLVVGAMFVAGGLAAAEGEQGDSARDTTITAWTILPVVFHTPETGTGGGVAGAHHYKHSLYEKPSTISWLAFYTEKKQTILVLNPEIYLSGGSRRLLLELGYEDFPNVFYGIGSGTLQDDDEDYREKSFDLEVAYEMEIRRNLRVGPRLDFRRSHIIETEAGGLLAGGRIRGVDKYRTLLLGLVLVYDGRDNILYTMNGSYLSVSTNYGGDATGSDHAYSRHSLDLRHFFGLGSRQAIGFRACLAAAGGSPPFQSLPGLGGEDLMRGFAGKRFRDRLAYTGQAEYRLKLPWRLGFAAFAALGDVAGDVDDFTESRIKFSGGAGLRFRLNKEGLNLRLDMGFTEEGSGFYFMAGEAF